MSPPPARARARAAWSRLPPVRKIGSIDFRLNRRTVVDGYGAGPPEKAVGSYRGVLRRGGKRDFSPYLNRGLGESHSTQYASTREKFVDPVWLTPRLGTYLYANLFIRLVTVSGYDVVCLFDIDSTLYIMYTFMC